MRPARRAVMLNVAAVATAAGASACCILPLAGATFGLGFGVFAIGAHIEPYRPIFLVLTAGALGLSFYREYRTGACDDVEECSASRTRRMRRGALWVVAIAAAVLAALPYFL